MFGPSGSSHLRIEHRAVLAVVASVNPEDRCVEVRKFTSPELQRPLLSKDGQHPS